MIVASVSRVAFQRIKAAVPALVECIRKEEQFRGGKLGWNVSGVKRLQKELDLGEAKQFV